MAVDIFQSQPGSVTAVDGTGVPMNLSLSDWEGFQGFKSIITGISWQTKAGVQYMHTFSDMLFVYVFSERAVPMTIQGYSFAAVCEDLIGVVEGEPHGIEFIYNYYLDQRVTENPEPVVLTLGVQTVLQGFLDGASFNLTDPSNLLATFVLTITTIPEPGLPL